MNPQWTLFKHASDDTCKDFCAFEEADVVPAFCSPFRLAPRESFSGFLAGVESTPFTHHHVAFVDAANVQDAWLGTLRAFVRLAAVSRRFSHVEPVVIGAYVTRSSNNIWTLGIVTSKCLEGRDIQSYWTASISKFGGDFTPSLRSATEAVNGGFSTSFPCPSFRASQRHITAASRDDDSVIERILPGKRLRDLILAGFLAILILIIAVRTVS